LPRHIRRGGQFQRRAFGAEKFIGNLDQQTGSVTGGFIAAHRTAVFQIGQDHDTIGDQPVFGNAIEIGETKPIPQLSCSCRGS